MGGRRAAAALVLCACCAQTRTTSAPTGGAARATEAISEAANEDDFGPVSAAAAATTVAAANTAVTAEAATAEMAAAISESGVRLGIGGGILLGATATVGAAGAAVIDEAEAARHAVDSDTMTAATSLFAPARELYNLSGFDGRPLAATSAALNARCQAAIADSLERALHADGPQPPRLYVDPLDGVRVGPVNGSDGVRFVYFVGIGDRPHAHLIVSRLLYALYSPAHLFLLHLDVKANPAAVEACYALQAKHANVHVVGARRLVQWGMWSMVSIALDAMHSVLSAGLAFDYFINLSDADLALRTDREMVTFFGRRSIRGRSLINVHDGGGPALMEATAFIDAHTIVECGGYGFVVVNSSHAKFPFTHGCCIGRSGPASFAKLPLETDELLQRHRVYTGSQWVALTYAFCRDLLGTTTGRRWLSAFVSGSLSNPSGRGRGPGGACSQLLAPAPARACICLLAPPSACSRPPVPMGPSRFVRCSVRTPPRPTHLVQLTSPRFRSNRARHSGAAARAGRVLLPDGRHALAAAPLVTPQP